MLEERQGELPIEPLEPTLRVCVWEAREQSYHPVELDTYEMAACYVGQRLESDDHLGFGASSRSDDSPGTRSKFAGETLVALEIERDVCVRDENFRVTGSVQSKENRRALAQVLPIPEYANVRSGLPEVAHVKVAPIIDNDQLNSRDSKE